MTKQNKTKEKSIISIVQSKCIMYGMVYKNTPYNKYWIFNLNNWHYLLNISMNCICLKKIETINLQKKNYAITDWLIRI